jgi:hypothetical protein
VSAVIIPSRRGGALVIPNPGGTAGHDGPAGPPGANVMAIALFTAAATLSIPLGTDVVRTAGYHTAGKGVADYVADAAVDAAYVTAHPKTSFISANARGFRLALKGFVWHSQLGAYGDYTGSAASGSGTDDKPAFDAYDALVKYLAQNFDGFFYQGAPVLWFDAPAYYSSDTYDAKVTINWQGNGGGQPGGNSTRIIYAADKAGVRLQAYDTLGEGVDPSPSTGADNSVVRGIAFESKGGTPNQLKAGIWLRTKATVENCTFDGFPGLGFLVKADVGGSGADRGNANGWIAHNIYIVNCKSGGIGAFGGDTNAGRCTSIAVNHCAGYGANIRAFLGTGAYDFSIASCGVNGAGGLNQTSMVTDGTYLYRLVDGQDALGATTPPTSGGSNAVWHFVGPGGVHPFFPLYSTYTGAYVSGGGCYVRGGTARMAALNIYNEGDQAPALCFAPSMLLGGFCEPTNPACPYVHGGDTSGGGISSTVGFQKDWTDPATGKRIRAGFGDDPGVPANVSVLHFYHSVYAPFLWRMTFGIGGVYQEDLWFSYQGSGSQRAWGITGPSTTQQAGTGAACPYHFVGVNFILGDDGPGRKLDYAGTVPAAGLHGKGSIVFNNNPNASGAGSNAGWICTATGTPGTHHAFGGVAATSSATYAAPAGGATVDTEGRASLAQLAADLADMKAKLQAAGIMV